MRVSSTSERAGTALRLSDCGDVLSVNELAQVLHVGQRQAYELLRRGDIFHRRIGRSLRVPRAAVERFLDDGPIEKSSPLAVVAGGGDSSP